MLNEVFIFPKVRKHDFNVAVVHLERHIVGRIFIGEVLRIQCAQGHARFGSRIVRPVQLHLAQVKAVPAVAGQCISHFMGLAIISDLAAGTAHQDLYIFVRLLLIGAGRNDLDGNVRFLVAGACGNLSAAGSNTRHNGASVVTAGHRGNPFILGRPCHIRVSFRNTQRNGAALKDAGLCVKDAQLFHKLRICFQRIAGVFGSKCRHHLENHHE